MPSILHLKDADDGVTVVVLAFVRETSVSGA
jgi:hypothetical protein